MFKSVLTNFNRQLRQMEVEEEKKKEANWEDIEETYILEGKEITKKDLQGYLEAVIRMNLIQD